MNAGTYVPVNCARCGTPITDASFIWTGVGMYHNHCAPQRVDAPPLPQLTDAQIDAVWHRMGSFWPNDHRYFAREIIKAAYGVKEAGHHVNAPASTDASSSAVRKAEDKLTESGSCIAARTALKESDQ